ncbi:MAG: hypothetical protein AMXMBFR74_23230 [Parvibaculum sp.]|uniref:nucleoid-associated protein n=1 Tax=Parvibaculum sp. TaxID=2024848 RepID=UPI0035B92800
MATTIANVAIHHLKRKDDAYVVTKGNSNVAVSATVQRLVDELHNLYGRRTSKAYGKFSEKVDNYPTSKNLKIYIEGKSTFDELTLALMDTLQKEAQAKVASTGGHVFFTHFSSDGSQYFLVAIVTDKLSAMLTKNDNLEDVTHLDVEGFRFAGRVNLSGWANDEARYIGFVKGKGNVADYFKEFLGCDTAIQNRVETTSLVSALKRFADQQKLDAVAREEFMQKARDICDRDARANKPIDFEALSNELYPHEPKKLSDVLCDPNLSLNDGFVADRRALKGLINFKRKTANWSVEFERSALHAGKVSYNPKENSITLFDVPDDLRSELNEEVGHA